MAEYELRLKDDHSAQLSCCRPFCCPKQGLHLVKVVMWSVLCATILAQKCTTICAQQPTLIQSDLAPAAVGDLALENLLHPNFVAHIESILWTEPGKHSDRSFALIGSAIPLSSERKLAACLDTGPSHVANVALGMHGGEPIRSAPAWEQALSLAGRVEQPALVLFWHANVVWKRSLIIDRYCCFQEGESSKQKSYRVLCELPREVQPSDLEALKCVSELVLAQFTPQRVAHRRALLERERTIHTLEAEIVAEQARQLVLRLRTQVRENRLVSYPALA